MQFVKCISVKVLILVAIIRQSGWGQGLTIHTCMMNIVPYLDTEDRPYALYHGLSAVAQDCASMPPRFKISSVTRTLARFIYA